MLAISGFHLPPLQDYALGGPTQAKAWARFSRPFEPKPPEPSAPPGQSADGSTRLSNPTGSWAKFWSPFLNIHLIPKLPKQHLRDRDVNSCHLPDRDHRLFSQPLSAPDTSPHQ